MCLLPINSAPIQSIPTPSVIYILNCERSTATHFAVQNNSQSSFSIQASRGPCVQRLEVDGTCWRHYITSVLSQTAEASGCPDHGPAALLHYCSAAGPWVRVSSLALWFDRCPVWPVQIHAETRNSYCLPDADYLPSLIVPGIDTLRERREVLTAKFFKRQVLACRSLLHSLLPDRCNDITSSLQNAKSIFFISNTNK